jgi:hypothetical protein
MFNAKTISICAKCSDMFSAKLYHKNGHQIGKDYDDYVPRFFPEQHFGDYVMLDIELETGKILNWRKPTEEDLKKMFEKNEEDD